MRTAIQAERPARARYTVELASPAHRGAVYRMRHAIYATELGQHVENSVGELRDDLDGRNVYIVGTVGERIAGFISITPPGERFAVDKYFARDALPFAFEEGLYELRLLSVAPEHRRGKLAALLMYAAFRWVEAHGGTHILALGRSGVWRRSVRVHRV